MIHQPKYHPMNCTHQFIKVEEIRKQGTAGAKVVCALCGSVREIFADGVYIIVIRGDKETVKK